MQIASISTRLTLGFAAIVTASTALVLVTGGWLLSGQMERGVEFLNQAEFEEVRERLSPDPAKLTAADISEKLRAHMLIDAAMYYCQVHNESGQVLFRSQNLGDITLPDLTGRELTHLSTELSPLGPILLSEFHLDGLHVQIASRLEQNNRLLSEYTRISTVLLAIAAVASVGLGYGFARFALMPVRVIRETASHITGDNLAERIPVSKAHDEISALATLLNQMFDRLELSFSEIRRFTAEASHELKTPLALIRLNAEKLRPLVANDPVATSALEDLLVETSRMHQIIESLLFIAKAESGALKAELKAEDAHRLIESFLEDAQALADDRSVRFLTARRDDGRVLVEPNLVRQLFLNLLTNALNVSSPGAQITLESIVGKEGWKLVLTDEGPGLPAEQLERIFDRFVRYEQNPAPTARPGHGLGLAICRSIAELHGGNIRAENRGDRSGLRLIVYFPKDADPKSCSWFGRLAASS